ncbi:TetR/AcrR family transcriptional regulator [Streptomyces sp. NBC_01591]|uniref:TetR family transcriptional regulator n=1 Tax=Streptomyces sp. NBC_01591 TaxID=2975888 RepID=UPI002DD82B50|nr:TetR family transcriptional regulator [Streptomyces sp. NBC_01591]WSD73518.1 TetR/AcrR family transcriptional regulator [Streptomyces sp. NBC_01591]
MREVLAEAAFQLFLERGFERTTVDDIVARAGVGRRSFFRYFPSKEDAVFPDHERCLADMTAFLAEAGDVEPVDVVSDAARLVLRMYSANPEFSVQRYRLTREVPGLRTYELSVVRRYEQTMAGYLRGRYGESGDGALRAEVIAASVVAAHNNGLRTWLRSGGEGDAEAAVDHALGMVRQVWGSAAAGNAPMPSADGDVVVMVAAKGAPMWRVVQQIESAIGRGCPLGPA